MDNIELERLIRRWYKNSSADTIQLNDPFDKFIFLWIGFNAWGRYETGEELDKKMIEALTTNDKLMESFNKAKENPTFIKKVNEFKNHPIPTHKRNPEYRSFKDENDFKGILWFIYTIRCNLFHGRKDPENPDEKKLVEWAISILRPIFGILKDRADFMQ